MCTRVSSTTRPPLHPGKKRLFASLTVNKMCKVLQQLAHGQVVTCIDCGYDVHRANPTHKLL